MDTSITPVEPLRIAQAFFKIMSLCLKYLWCLSSFTFLAYLGIPFIASLFLE